MLVQENAIEAALVSIQGTLSVLRAPSGTLPLPPASVSLADRLVEEPTSTNPNRRFPWGRAA
jgi:hypothetical protein